MTHQRFNEQSQKGETHRENWLHWDIPGAHKTTHKLQELTGNNVIPVLEKYMDGKYFGTFCRLELSVPELTAPAFPPLNKGWQNPAVRHLSLGDLHSQALELLVLLEPEQNPWLKEERLGFRHKNQRPHLNSKILFSAFLKEPLKVCMAGFHLSKERLHLPQVHFKTLPQ